MSADVDQLYQQHVRPLSGAEQLQLVERIVKGLAAPQPGTQLEPRSIMELHGKGAEVWRGVDPAAYVEHLRSEWDHRP